MHIIHFSSEYPPQPVFGLGRYVAELATMEASQGHKVEVFTNSLGGNDQDVIQNNVHVHRVHFPPPPKAPTSSSMLLHFNLQLVERCMEVYRNSTIKPDLVVAHDWLTYPVSYHCSRILHCPIVVIIHDVIFNKVRGREFTLEDEYIAGIENWACQTSSKIIALSKTVRDELVGRYKANPDRVRTIRGGVGIAPATDADVESIELWRGKAHADECDLILYAGRLDAEKGIPTMLEAARLLAARKQPNWKLVIAGTGLLEEWIDKFVLQHRLQEYVARCGYLKFAELRHAYAAADIVVIPSEYEPFGLVSLEAQRMGTPVVVSNTGGLAETLTITQGGLSFTPGNATELADALQKLLNDRDLRHALGKKGQQEVGAHFNWSTISSELTEEFQAAVGVPGDTAQIPNEPPPPARFGESTEPLSNICLFLDAASGIETKRLLLDITSSHAFRVLGGKVFVIRVRTGSEPLGVLPVIPNVVPVQADSGESIHKFVQSSAACVVPVELSNGLVQSGVLDPTSTPCLWIGNFRQQGGLGINVCSPVELRGALDRLLCDQRFRQRTAPQVDSTIPQVAWNRNSGRNLVLHVVPQFVTGGAETTLLEIVKGTRKEFSHALLCMGPLDGPLPNELMALDTPILMAEALSTQQVLEKIRQLQPTLFHVHGCGYVPSWMRIHRQLAHARIVETEHVVNIGAGMFGPVDKVICVSKAAREAHEPYAFLENTKQERFEVIYNGISQADYQDLPSPEDARKKLNLPLDRPLIGRVSALARNKFPLDAIRAFVPILKRIPNALVVIVGDGEQRREAEQEVQRLGIQSHVLFLGERRDIPQVLRAFDVFAYYTEKDALGNVILEAIAAGVPVVCTEVEGTSEALGDAPGELVKLRDFDSFAASVEKWVRKSRERKVPAYTLPSHFTRQEMARKYLRVYSEMALSAEKLPEGPAGNKWRILIKFPTRGRPAQFLATFERYQSLLSGKHDVRFVISCDNDDSSMNNPEAISKLKKWNNAELTFSNNRSKVEAINSNLDQYAEGFDILILASDDMIPEVQGYDDVIAQQMEEYFPDTDGVLFFNDGYRGRDLNTLVVMGSSYFKRFNFIYNPEYQSLWCDNEFTDIARRLGRAVYCPQVLIRHQHPANLGQSYDPLYQRNEAFFESDKQTYLRRKEITESSARRIVLSILIASLESRKAQLSGLLQSLRNQIAKAFLLDSVEIVCEIDNGERSIGTKRNSLITRAAGEYVCFVDDDDTVSLDYVESLFNYLADGSPDCVGFCGRLQSGDGLKFKRFVHSLSYNDYSEVDNVYYRPPNHLNPIRREIAQKYPFKDVSKEEDLDFCMRVARDGALKVERFIQRELYFYTPSIFQSAQVEVPSRKERILFVLLFRLGDVLCGRAIFEQIRHRHPKAHLAWVTLPQYAQLVPRSADEVIEYGNNESIFTLKMPEWAKEWDKVYDVQPGWHLAEWDRTKLPLVRFIAHLAGFTFSKVRLNLPLPAVAHYVVDSRIAQLKDFVVINAGPHVSGPNWAHSARQQLVDQLQHLGWKVVALAGPDGSPLKNCLNIFDLNYFEAAALIERARLYIGQDCGTSWLACTTQVPKLLLVDRSEGRKGYDSYVDCLENPEIQEVPLSISVEALQDLALTILGNSQDLTLCDALNALVRSRGLRKVIETGAYEGEGTTRALASALKESNGKLYSIEANRGLSARARSNLSRRGLEAFVEIVEGISVPHQALPSVDEIENELKGLLEENPTLHVDHDSASRARGYHNESNHQGLSDCLRLCVERFEGKPDLIVLDSAGHLGKTEFEYVIRLLKQPCILALDDTNHVKHFRSVRALKNDSRFKVLKEGNAGFGYCIAEFDPNVAQGVG